MSDWPIDGTVVSGDLADRFREFMADPAPWQWWWLSFVDTTRSAPWDEQVPGGGGFTGVCIVPGPNIVVAARIAFTFGCNPGGEVAGVPLPIPSGWRPRREYVARLFDVSISDVEFGDLLEAAGTPQPSPVDPSPHR